jgi:hypothetical protein
MMGYGYLTKRQLFSKETGLHIALRWNEVREADVSREECCRTKWCRTCEHVSTDLYWLNSNASRAGPVISVILFYLFSQEQGKSRQPLRLLAVLLPLLLQNESRHARISQEPNCSKNIKKCSKAGIPKQPTWTNSDISMHGQTLTVLGTCSRNFLCLYCCLVCQVPAACAMRHSIDHFKIFQAT